MRHRALGAVGFDEDIRPLISIEDRDRMRHILDLHDWSTMRANAPLVLSRLRGEGGVPVMPPGGWPTHQIDLFAEWLADGAPKRRAQCYAAFFRDLGSYGTYHDLYGRPRGEDHRCDYLRVVHREESALLELWRERAAETEADEQATLWREMEDELAIPSVRDAVLRLDKLVEELAILHFDFGDGIDELALLDAFGGYGMDRLPRDVDRAERLERGGARDARVSGAAYHRMEATATWFHWAGLLECADALRGNEGHRVRRALLAGIALGCASDFVHRRAMPVATRARYYGPRGPARLWREALRALADWQVGVGEVHAQFAAYAAGRAGWFATPIASLPQAVAAVDAG